MDNKRKPKRRKIKLTKLGKEVVASISTLAILGASIGIAHNAVSASTKEQEVIPTLETIQTDMEDIFEVNELTPIINRYEVETTSITPTPTTIETTETTTPTETEEEIQSIETTPSIEETIITDETTPVETTLDLNSSLTISMGYAPNRNENDDLLKYNTVRQNYGPLIDYISSQTRWDPRLITAIIAQENPFKVDQSSNYTYGITSITTVHQGQTYNYGYFDENGNHEIRSITVDVYSLDNNDLFMGGLYGNVTTGDYNAIITQIAILENYMVQINNSNSYLGNIGSGILAMPAYNSGVGSINNVARNNTNLNESLNDLVNESNPYADPYYFAHVFYKIPNGMTNDLYFTSLDGETTSFNVEFTYEVGGISASNTNTHTL